jgi:hypothetical protein
LIKTKKWDDAAALIIDGATTIQPLTQAEYREPVILAELQLAENVAKSNDFSSAMTHAQVAKNLAEIDPARNSF